MANQKNTKGEGIRWVKFWDIICFIGGALFIMFHESPRHRSDEDALLTIGVIFIGLGFLRLLWSSFPSRFK